MRMRINFLFPILLFFFFSCKNISSEIGHQVSNALELKDAIQQAKPGDNIILRNGIYKDLEINFFGEGEEVKPITIKAETPGEVFIEGQSFLKLAGKHLIVNGLYFRNGSTPSNAVIAFRINEDSLAHQCRVTNCVIEDFNQSERDKRDHWVEFWGRHNMLDHCYIAGKSNKGPTVRVQIKGIESINNYHQIVHNHFGPRPRKGGPSAETIQIGDLSLIHISEPTRPY